MDAAGQHLDPSGHAVSAAFDGFHRWAGRSPSGVWAAPGRVNLIGEHTDYNDGFVLPFALGNRTLVAAAPRTDATIRVISTRYEQEVSADAASLDPAQHRLGGWGDYVLGVAWALREQGVAVQGADLSISSDVPVGAGLSSSAALECAVALTLDDLWGSALSPDVLRDVAWRAETEWVGVPCGVMDQTVSLRAEADHLLFVDARSGITEQIPIDLADSALSILVINTNSPHRLSESAYDTRVAACSDAAEQLGVSSLRDVTDVDVLTALPSPLRPIARHVVTENQRVLDVVAALRAGEDVRDVGPALSASHESLARDYQVSSPELDTAVSAALAVGSYGARMTGGGFGGSAIALVNVERIADTEAAVHDAFGSAGFAPPSVFAASPATGAQRLV